MQNIKLIDTTTGSVLLSVDCLDIDVNVHRLEASGGVGLNFTTDLHRDIRVNIKNASIHDPAFMYEMSTKFLVNEYWTGKITIQEFMRKVDRLREVFGKNNSGE